MYEGIDKTSYGVMAQGIDQSCIETGRGGSTPSQYGIPEGAKDLQDLIEHRDMNFAIGNIFKACYRLGTKNDDLYELNKIKWFVERELQRVTQQS